jgi:hypothetical protein
MINDEELLKAIAEVQQARSNFQLSYFVIGQHKTPEMQYYQLLLEINDLMFKYKIALIENEIQEAKIKALEVSGDQISLLEAKKLKLILDQTKVTMIGSERELAHLYTLWKSLPIKYSRQEIESGQQEYWKARLTHDVEMQVLTGSVNPTHLGTLDQIGILEDFISDAVLKRDEPKNELTSDSD